MFRRRGPFDLILNSKTYVLRPGRDTLSVTQGAATRSAKVGHLIETAKFHEQFLPKIYKLRSFILRNFVWSEKSCNFAEYGNQECEVCDQQ